MKHFVIAIAALLLASPALAGGSKHHQPDPRAVSVSGAHADGGSARSTSDADANATARVNNDVSNAQGQIQGQHQSASSDQSQSQSANNEGNTLGVTTYYREVRQAPAIGQGSVMITGCSVGGNAGASSQGGAGFLGFAFTPAECYAFILAQAYEAVGEREAACAVLNTTKAAKRAVDRGLTLPTCVAPVQAVAVPIPTGDYVTREELAERDARILRQVLSK